MCVLQNDTRQSKYKEGPSSEVESVGCRKVVNLVFYLARDGFCSIDMAMEGEGRV